MTTTMMTMENQKMADNQEMTEREIASLTARRNCLQWDIDALDAHIQHKRTTLRETIDAIGILKIRQNALREH